MINFIENVRIQLRVIGALMMRELHTRYGRESIGFAWFIGEPIVFALGVTLLWANTRGTNEHGVSVIAFVITGYIPMLMWRHCYSQAISAVRANGSLFYHKQVTLLDVLISRSLIEIAGSILTFVLTIFLLSMILQVVELPNGELSSMLGGWLIYAWFSFATALLMAYMTEMSHTFEKLAQIIGYIMVPLCGAFWMVDWLPQRLQEIVLYLPSVDSFEMIRDGYFGHAVVTHYAPWIACAVCAVMTFVGLLMLKQARNHLAVE